MNKTLSHLVWAGFILGCAAHVGAQVNVAEVLLVDVRAEDLSYGSSVTTWTNHGTLGDFTAQGAPVVEDVAGLKAVTFDGTCWFDGPTTVPGIEGAGTRSIEVWVHNPTTVGEETMVHWSHRGGPAGTNMAFNYGNHGTWGAVGHWDAPDMPWGGSVSPTPTLGKWWHLVYTYDGSTARLYANGSPAGEKAVSLNTHAGNIIRIAAQGDDSGQGVASQLNFTGSIAQVRIHDGVLTPKQIQDNFKLGGPRKASNPIPPDGATGVATPLFQWTAGTTAGFHDLFLGKSPDLGPAELVGKGLMVAMYWHVPGLEPGTTYYWRVDEVEADGVTTYTGDVWSLTTVSLTAHTPSPPDGARFETTDVHLTWMMGKDAVSHDVYFSSNKDDVTNGAPTAFQGNQLATTFDPGPLVLDTAYYWRVDEVEKSGTKRAGAVWSFRTLPDIAVSDPNLVGWWKFDEGAGSLVVDWSGRGGHGIISGGTQWVDGFDGGALNLLGLDGYVTLPIGPIIGSLGSTTMTTWVNFSNAGGAWQRIFDFGSNTTAYMFLTPRTGTAGPMRFGMTTGGGGAAEQMVTAPSTLPSGWHHVAVVIDAATRGMQLYLDGAVVATGSTQVLPRDLGETTSNWIGRSQYAADAYLRGAVDDFRIYDFAMTADEIPETMRGDPMLAWDPRPARDTVVDVRSATPLMWSAGDRAAQHDVYFGTDAEAVAAADASDTSGIYRGRQQTLSYTPGEGVEWGQTYHWRIDEHNTDGTLSAGRLWSFTVAEYLIVDDFESYTDDEGSRIYETWIDGYADQSSGSQVGHLQAPFAEQQIVNSGRQSMPFEYNNVDAPWYSEAVRTWTDPQDWTFGGVDTLVIHLRGNPLAFLEKAPDNLLLSAAGADIGGTADQCRFAYKQLNGNGAITARVDSLINTDAWAKAGVMIRETLDPGARHAAVVVTPSNGVSFPYRALTNDVSNQVNQTGVQAPYWVRLTRTGNTFRAEHSADGKAWTALGAEQSITMLNTVYIGLALTSHDAGATTVAEFSAILTTGGATGSWQVAEIGVDHPDNSQDDLYIAAEDSSGRTAVVVNPDPAALLTTQWTPWSIPLSSLSSAGVNLKSVKRMYLGVGDRNNPQRDGAGIVYFDDIRLTGPAPEIEE